MNQRDAGPKLFMPILLTESSAISATDKIDAFRRKIKPGEGWSAEEVAAKTGINIGTVCRVMLQNKWQVIRYIAGRKRQLLVNPNDLYPRK